MKCIKAILLIFLTTGNILPAHTQVFHNLDFKQTCDSSKTGLCYWDLSWGSKGSVSQDQNGTAKCLLIKGSKVNNVGFTEQSSTVKSNKGIQIITVSAAICSKNIEGKGAGLDIQAMDKDGRLIAFKDMGGIYSVNWVQGTSSWKTYSISLVCPAEAHTIKVGAILYGKGMAWFKDYKVSTVSIANRRPSNLAIKYISAACDTLQQHSLFRDSINIKELKETAFKIAGNAKTYNDCYLAVNYLLESLRPYGDEHSFFMTPKEVTNLQNGGSLISKIKNPSYKLIDECGYILVPPFHGTNPQRKLEYADSLQMAIQRLYALGVKGWIIDLRENTGGDMEPMVAGLGPLFSSEKLGSLVDVNKKYDSWYYEKGKYYWDDGYSSQVLHHVSLDRQLPIAVLTSNQTGSSGEAVVVSFIGNAQTRFFGQPTWGLTTGNGSYNLIDGANIHLASTIMADRIGKLYHGPIQPDEIIKVDPRDKEDVILKAAVKWILNKY
jgi:hypothetical protein